MSLYEWLLFLHLLAAFLLVAGLVAYGVMVFGSGDAVVSRTLGPPATALWNAGGLGVIVFGVWLALEVDGYELWDGWIIAAIVLWLVGSGSGGRLATGVREGRSVQAIDGARAMVTIMALATLLLLLDMIFKPGA
jgi:Ca2+/H+ antiporter